MTHRWQRATSAVIGGEMRTMRSVAAANRTVAIYLLGFNQAKIDNLIGMRFYYANLGR
jgi:hypothetical protein